MTRAEQEAYRVLKTCKVSKPPIAVETVARQLGAQVSFERFGGDVSGILYREESSAVIAVNAGHTNTRQRFTIAHELGHLRLHKGRPMFVDHSVRIDRRDVRASRGVDREEIEANAFAAALLMPEGMLFTALQRTVHARAGDSFDAIIRRLANRFDVSSQSMEYRLANLGLVVPPQ